MNNSTKKQRQIDLVWLLLIGLTIAMFLLDHDSQNQPWFVAAILGMAVLKSTMISAIFMGLLRASRPALFALTSSFIALGGTLTLLLS